MSNENAEKLLTFIEQSPSAFHVVYNMRRQLDAAGFVYLPENKPMNIEYGKAYYTIRNDASLIAGTRARWITYCASPQSIAGFFDQRAPGD